MSINNILVGTAYSQVIKINPNLQNPANTMVTYGALYKDTITNIVCYQNKIYYTNAHSIYCAEDDVTNQIVQVNSNVRIIGLHLTLMDIYYALSDATLIKISLLNDASSLEYRLDTKITTKNKYYNKCILSNDKCLFIGRNVLPFMINIIRKQLVWKGKNVPNDELDLQTPINDIDISFCGQNEGHIAVLNGSLNRIRFYDTNNNRNKPYMDYELFIKNQFTSCMKLNPSGKLCYVGCTRGGIYEYQLGKKSIQRGKFKGITTTVTDLQITSEYLICCSLDCYVRIYGIEDRYLQVKIYLNKHLSKLVLEGINRKKQDVQFQQEEQFNRETIVPKTKLIRKRNKVGLRYLQSRVSEILVKREEEKQDNNINVELNEADKSSSQQIKYMIKQNDIDDDEDI